MDDSSATSYGLAPEIEGSLEASRWEGVSSQIAVSILDFFLVPFALYIGTRDSQLGLLMALPSFVSAIALFFVVDIVRIMGNRRSLIVWGAILQAVVLAPLPIFAVHRVPWAVGIVFALVCAYRVIGAIMGPPWGSLMSDYLPEQIRGDYFGQRSQLVGIWGMVSAAVCGTMLHYLGRLSEAISFCLLLVIACVARTVSIRYMREMANLPEHAGHRAFFRLSDALSRVRTSNLARFVLYVSGINFATQVSAAYFSVHMLKDLHFDFIPFTAVGLASAMMAFGAYPAWGRHADVVGNARVLRFNSLLMPIIPVLWCLTEKAWLLVLIEGLSGFIWAGFNLCTANFIYDAVPPAKRVQALGWYNLINGAALFLGGACGSFLADRLPPVFGFRLHTLFLVSAAMRLVADFALSRHFREARPTTVSAGSAELFFSVVGVHPLSGAGGDIDWDPPAKLARQGQAAKNR